MFSLGIPDVLLVNATPSKTGKGIICHFREISGKTCKLDPRYLFKLDKAVNCAEVNAIGEFIRKVNEPVIFQPNSVHFLEITWND